MKQTRQNLLKLLNYKVITSLQPVNSLKSFATVTYGAYLATHFHT